MSEPMRQPIAGRPVVPDGYGVPENNDDLLPWSFVEQCMAEAKNYWIATANKRGQPAATPVWGAWVNGKLYFDGDPKTRRGRNISENPRVLVHLESGDEVLILEGRAQILAGAPDRALAEKVSEGYRAKYSALGYSPTPEQWDGGGLFIFEAETAIAWTKFPKNMTRWKFEK